MKQCTFAKTSHWIVVAMVFFIMAAFKVNAAIGDATRYDNNDANYQYCSYTKNSSGNHFRPNYSDPDECIAIWSVTTEPEKVYEMKFVFANKGNLDLGYISSSAYVRLTYLDESGIEQEMDIEINQRSWLPPMSDIIGNFANLTKVTIVAYQRVVRTYVEDMILTEVDAPADNVQLPIEPVSVTPGVGQVDFFYNEFAMEQAGYIPIDGNIVYADVYPELVLVLTGGDVNAQQARLRDCRGEFIRGRDLGRGIDTERVPGEHQMDSIKSHNHTFNHAGYAGVGNHGFETGTGSFEHHTNYTGGSETRPRNLDFVCAINPGRKLVE